MEDVQQVSHEIGNIFDLAYKLFHVIDDNHMVNIELFDAEYVPDSRTLFDMLAEVLLLGLQMKYGKRDDSVDYAKYNTGILAQYPELSPTILREFNKRADLDSLSLDQFAFIKTRMRQMHIDIVLEIAAKDDKENATYQKLVGSGYDINSITDDQYMMARDYSEMDKLEEHVLRIMTMNNIYNMKFSLIRE